MIPRSVIAEYLRNREGTGVRLLKYEKLGSGWHGTGYKVKFKTKDSCLPAGTARLKTREKEIVIRTLMPENFSHDFLADRAKVFVLQHEMAAGIPGHVKSFDVSGYTKGGKLVSLGETKEFFQVVEVAYGTPYSADFLRIKESNRITEQDRKRAKLLSDHLVKLHAIKFKGSKEAARSLRRRHSRDALGHGEMMIGVIDTYPDNFSFISKENLTDIICKAARFREKIKDVPFTPCRMHGDFHPGNVLFDGGKVRLLDASREVFGDPADDLTTMAINYIWFAVMQTGSFKGPFAELFNIFWDNYFSKVKDPHIQRTAGIYFAFRGVVVAHPVFYSAQSDDVRRKMMRFVDNVLDEESFDPTKINEYLR